jgi:hypothetical protein
MIICLKSFFVISLTDDFSLLAFYSGATKSKSVILAVAGQGTYAYKGIRHISVRFEPARTVTARMQEPSSSSFLPCNSFSVVLVPLRRGMKGNNLFRTME